MDIYNVNSNEISENITGNTIEVQRCFETGLFESICEIFLGFVSGVLETKRKKINMFHSVSLCLCGIIE